jgi:hypothetical protein
MDETSSLSVLQEVALKGMVHIKQESIFAKCNLSKLLFQIETI